MDADGSVRDAGTGLKTGVAGAVGAVLSTMSGLLIAAAVAIGAVGAVIAGALVAVAGLLPRRAPAAQPPRHGWAADLQTR
jgi:hypothetical protein